MAFRVNFISHPARTAALAIMIIVLWTNLGLKFWQKEERLLVWDVKQFYVYLPAVFIYHDLSLQFVEDQRDEIGDVMFLERNSTGQFYIQATYGLALLYSPFFLGAHTYATLSGGDANGYSPPYKFALMLSCIFYLAIGIYFFKKILLKYFSQWATAITLVAIVLGTNLFYYSTYEGPVSHAYNFALIAVFIYFTTVWYEKANFKNTLIIGFLTGLITIIRPVNLLVVIFFILWDISSWKSFLDRILFLIKSWKWILIMFLVSVVIWIPQLLYWKFISGSYFFYSYTDQRFFFNNPQVLSSLFSYRKGLFLYIPLMVLAYGGIPFLYRKFRGLILPVAFFAAINIYVLSSWCFWWFGGSFGPRSYIDTYAILAIPFAAITSQALQKKWVIKIAFLLLFSGLIWFNFFQTKKYFNGSINWSGMTKEAYWDSFLLIYPSNDFYDKLRFPNRDSATKGIYYRGDLTYDELLIKSNIITPLDTAKSDLERYIENFDKYIRTNEEWFNKIKEKAALKGISIDSAIRLDGKWLYELDKEKDKEK
jgi:hypothetical protein